MTIDKERNYHIVQNLERDNFATEKMKLTYDELKAEADDAAALV